MNKGIYEIRPFYNKNIKVSGWVSNAQTYPRDCPNIFTPPNLKAHYKTFGGPTKFKDFRLPKTTTQEQTESGYKIKKQTTLGMKKNIVNFTSYPITDTSERYNLIKYTNLPSYSTYQDISCNNISVYKDDYESTFPGPLIPLMMVDPHPLQNRLTKAELISDPIYCPHKFMDDHLAVEKTSSTMIVKRNLKKLRCKSFNFCTGEYTDYN